MIKTAAMLMDELKNYANPAAKIRRLVDNGKLIPIVRGLYETDANIPGYCLASSIYGPSYLSFEFALARHGLIPEAVYHYTSATFEKKRAKEYRTPFGVFQYRDVPSEAYPLGIILHMEEGYSCQIASPEKALADQLYKVPPFRNQRELEQLLFQDLRIDPHALYSLNLKDLIALSSCYHTRNHRLLQAYIKRRINFGTDS